MPEDVIPVGSLKPIQQPSTQPVGNLKPIGGMVEGFNPNDLIQNQDKFNEVLNNIEDVSEDEKNIIKKLALAAHDGDKGVTSADVSDAILTLQRQHPDQKGGNKYYVKEVAPEVYKPIAIANDEKPPKGYDVASIWGTQGSANDDTAITSLGKHLWNGVVGASEGVANLAGLGYGVATGEDAEWYQTLKNSAKSLKFATPDYEKGEIFNTEGIKSASDFFDPSRYDFSKDKVQGQIFQGLESLTSFLLGTKGVSGITGATSKAGKIGEAYVGSYAVNYGESLQAAEDAGLTGREKYAYAGITTVPTAALDVAFGTEGLFVRNQLARDGKKKMLESLAKGFKEDIGGKLTKESLEDLYKTTTAAATTLNKSFTRQLGENILEEAGTESAQALVQNGAQMIYDQISKEPKFGKDAFSLESIGEYLNNAIGGAFGAAGPGVYGVSRERKASKEELQSSNAYEAVKKGKDAVNALRADVYSSYKSGDLSQQEAANAVSKINAYYDFNQQLGETKLPDEQRKQVLDLAFQKELLYNSIKDTDKEKLSPIEMAKYEAKAKMAKDIQSQINDIVLKPEVEKEVTVGDKTMEDIAKKEEKEAEAGTTKPEKKVKVDERKFEVIPPVDWNTKKASEKFKILTRDLQESNEPVQGSLTLESGGPGRTTSDTVHVNLPGNKFVITASSAKSLATQLRGHFKTEFVEGDIENLPVVVKPLQLVSGKTVLGIYNEGNGKFISYVREDDKGGSKYSEKEIEHLQHLQATDKLNKGEIEYFKNKRQPPPADEAGTKETKTPVTPVMPQGGLKPISDVTTTRQTTGEGITAGKTEPVTGDVSEATQQDVENVKETKVRKKGFKRHLEKIENTSRLKAITHDVFSPYHAALQYFSGKGNVSSKDVANLLNRSGLEARKRRYARSQEIWGNKIAPSIDDIAHLLWEEHGDNINADVQDYKNAIEDVIKDHETSVSAADKLNELMTPEGEQYVPPTENEKMLGEAEEIADEEGVLDEFSKVKENIEKLDDNEFNHIANLPEKEFDAFGNEIVDIIIRKDLEGDVFQKDKLKTIENEAESIIKGESILKRFSQAEQRGIAKGGSVHAGASIILATENSTNSTSNISNEEQENRVEQYAKEKGVWIENVNKEFNKKYGNHIAAGEESLVWNNGNTVVKSQNMYMYNDLQEKLDGITLFNTQFPEAAVKVIGFGRNKNGEFQVLIEQPFIEAHPTKKVTQKQINEYLEKAGYTYENENNFSHSQTLIEDLHTGNVILTPNENLIVIDPLMRLNTPEQGYGGKRKIEAGIYKSNSKENKQAIDKIVEKLKKSMPKVKVVYNRGMEQSGLFSPEENIIYINPLRAGLDTPIHEYGHVFIEAIGYNNKVIQSAIKQLKSTPLWKATAERYTGFNEKDLGIEVLAEAIGLEGEGIFEKEADKSKFRQYLEYIFDWLKTKLGLNKNVARSLAKQIVAGIGTKEMQGKDGVAKEQRTKPMENKSDKELEYSTIGSFESYRSKALNRNLQAIKKSIRNAKAKLADEEITAEETKGLQEILDYHANLEAQDKKAYMDYRNDMSEIKGLVDEKEIHKYSEEELFKIYNNIINFQKYAKGTLLPDVMKKIGMALFDKQSNALKNDPKTKEMFDEDLSKTKDLTPTEVRMKVLSHMTQNFPELQALNKLYDSAVFAKEKEAKEKKRTLEKLGKKVIEEKNKQLGIATTVGSAFSSDSAKYFEYLDNGQGEYLTVNEAKKKGLSDAQIEFLKYMRELVAEREGLASIGADVGNMIMEVVKIDPGFRETYKQSGLVSAYSHLLGDTYNISNVRIPYTDPNTGKENVTEFKNIENILIAYGKQGLPQMLKALALLTKYNWRARKQLKVGKNYDQRGEENKLKIITGGEYTLDGNGNLIGKFDRKRNKDRGYSKDFYKAAMSYIDDTAHVKHMTPLMPAINSIQYLNENGVFGEKGEVLHGKKPSVAKWLEDWRDMHIFKKEKETIPELDFALKALRFMTSATTMWFNLPAGAMNLGIGLYNNWRAQTEPILRKGNARLFLKGSRKGSKGYGLGTLNPYAVDLIRKYNVVSTDIDSNPKIFAGRIFDTIANGATRFGEFIVQGSGVLGLMDEKLYNSFEYKKDKHGVEQLVVKEGLDEKEIEKKILALRNRISDIQGKYADKDKRNFMNNELGKAVMQLKVWIPDFWKERFGQPYINADGEYRQGSIRPLIKDGFKDLRAEFKKQGINALKANTPDAIAFRQNLKGLMAITLLSILANTGDDDEEKSLAVKMASKGLSDILFIFNPTDQGTLKFTLSKPIAGMSVVDRFIDTADHLLAFEEDDYYKRTGAPKIGNDILNVMPGKKLIKAGVDLISDDE